MDKRGEGEINLQEFKEALMEGWALLEEFSTAAVSTSTSQLVRGVGRSCFSIMVTLSYVFTRPPGGSKYLRTISSPVEEKKLKIRLTHVHS